MAKKIQKIAEALGATIVGPVPDVGGGPLGAAKLRKIVAGLQEKMAPSVGKRPGRPTKPEWSRRPKVPMTPETERRLIELARKASTPKRRISPMQLAGQLLEEALGKLTAE